MIKKCVTYAVLISTILLAGCSSAQDAVLYEKAPDFSLPDINGRIIRLSDYYNKVVILNFFATWCPPCREEIPVFIEMVNTEDSGKFAIIAISIEQGDAAAVKRFAGKKRINYPVLIDDGIVSNAYGNVYRIPTTFIIDKKGNIIKKIVGTRTKAEFEKIIKPLL